MPIQEIRLTYQLFREFFSYLSYSIIDEDTFYINLANTFQLTQDNPIINLKAGNTNSIKEMASRQKYQYDYHRAHHFGVSTNEQAPFDTLEQFDDYSQYSKPKSSVKSHSELQETDFKLSPQQKILRSFDQTIKKRGLKTLIEFIQAFEHGQAKISFQFFQEVLQRFRITFNYQDQMQLFEFFQTERSGIIDVKKIVDYLVQPLNDFRCRLVHSVFERITQHGLIQYDSQRLREKFHSQKFQHSSIFQEEIQNHKRELIEFCDYQIKQRALRYLDRHVFEAFYTYLSQFYTSDDVFQKILDNSWTKAIGKDQSLQYPY